MTYDQMSDTIDLTSKSATAGRDALLRSQPSQARRTLLKAGWIAPVTAVVSLPASSYVANGSGFDPNKD